MSQNSSSSFSYFTETSTKFTFEQTLFLSAMITKFLVVVPLSILILCLACRRWRRHRSLQTASHADIFAYNAAVFELVFGLGVIFYFSSYHTGASGGVVLGISALSFAFSGEINLHIMTCLEQYLAVLHPVIYLGLRQSGGTRIRNICVVCVWLLSFGWVGIVAYFYPEIPFILYFVYLATSLVIVSFCSLSALCALFRRKPVGGANRSTKKAFVTITAILGVIVVYFSAGIVALAAKNINLLSDLESSVFQVSVQWFSLPLSLVLLLLFLQRAEELRC